MRGVIKEIMISTLTDLRKRKQQVHLSLQPGIGETTISPSNNRLFVNEGRDGIYKPISEREYDELVKKYDTRVKKYRAR